MTIHECHLLEFVPLAQMSMEGAYGGHGGHVGDLNQFRSYVNKPWRCLYWYAMATRSGWPIG